MKAEIENIPSENRGIEVTSENEEERQHLESLWSRHSAVLVLTRNRGDGSVTLTIGPVAQEEEEEWIPRNVYALPIDPAQETEEVPDVTTAAHGEEHRSE